MQSDYENKIIKKKKNIWIDGRSYQKLVSCKEQKGLWEKPSGQWQYSMLSLFVYGALCVRYSIFQSMYLFCSQ